MLGKPQPPDVSVVLPTLNEKATIRRTLQLLDRELSAQSFSSEIVVVDDRSTDGTVESVARIPMSVPIHVVVRRKESGLASAILMGFQEAQGSICVVLDADGSHPPSLVPLLISPLLSGKAEMAIGSRYANGGGVRGWIWYRQLMSMAATILARPLTRKEHVQDPMSGFFSVRKSVLSRSGINPIGFKLGFEILVRCHPHPVVEVPYQFHNRVAGQSKLSPRQVADYVRHLGQLYSYTYLGPSRHTSP